MKKDLRVPYAEKDEAKRLGARWDPARKVWYIENVADTTPFSRWMPSAGTDSLPDAGAKERAVPANQTRAGNGLITGSNYAPQARVCDCLPWDVCDRCRASALS